MEKGKLEDNERVEKWCSRKKRMWDLKRRQKRRQIKTQTAWHRAEDVMSHELRDRDRDVEGDILELSTRISQQ